MPSIKDFLPQPPWEGPPIPNVFSQLREERKQQKKLEAESFAFKGRQLRGIATRIRKDVYIARQKIQRGEKVDLQLDDLFALADELWPSRRLPELPEYEKF